MLCDAVQGKANMRLTNERVRTNSKVITFNTLGKKGGALISAIEAYVRHGDPFVTGLVKRLLKQVRVQAVGARALHVDRANCVLSAFVFFQVCTPLYSMIDRWISAGELADPFGEFFVAADAAVPRERLCTCYCTVGNYYHPYANLIL